MTRVAIIVGDCDLAAVDAALSRLDYVTVFSQSGGQVIDALRSDDERAASRERAWKYLYQQRPDLLDEPLTKRQRRRLHGKNRP